MSTTHDDGPLVDAEAADGVEHEARGGSSPLRHEGRMQLLVGSSTQFRSGEPWHFLYFFPLPHGQGSFRPTFGTPTLGGREAKSTSS